MSRLTVLLVGTLAWDSFPVPKYKVLSLFETKSSNAGDWATALSLRGTTLPARAEAEWFSKLRLISISAIKPYPPSYHRLMLHRLHHVGARGALAPPVDTQALQTFPNVLYQALLVHRAKIPLGTSEFDCCFAVLNLFD